jgi:hypothetical protein
MPFSTVQRVFIVEHYFRTQSYEAVKHAYQVHFPDAAVPNKSTIFCLDSCLRETWWASDKRVVSKIVWVGGNKCRSQWSCGLRRGSWPVGCWDRGFESRSRHGCLSASFCVVLLACVGRGLATG